MAVATATEFPHARRVERATPTLDEAVTRSSDQRLWSRAGVGVLAGMATAAVLAFILITVLQPQVSLVAAVGFAAYVGFWGGAFFGTTAAVGYHYAREAKL